MDWVASLARGLLMVVLPLAALAIGIASVDWHDDTLRKAVIAKTWDSAPAGTNGEKPGDAREGENAEAGTAQGDQPKSGPEADGDE